MIIVKLQGGLGNQMFQYAIYKKFRLLGVESTIDDYEINEKGNQHNGNELNRVFSIKYDRADRLECDNYCKRRNFREKVLGKVQKIFSKQWIPDVLYEEVSKYDGRILRNRNAYLNGYWQSFKYFEDIREALLNDFVFSDNVSNDNSKKLEMIEMTESVSVHIRRGDYVTNYSDIYGNICNDEYYDKAINYLRVHKKGCKFFFFSNDIEWVKNKYSSYDDVEFVDTNNGVKSYYDMYLMSKCKHNIIANSSFSWWGGWLNKNINKIVVAPSKWINCIDADDIANIIPDNWVKI